MKFLKDERVQSNTNKIKAEAFNIIMVMAFAFIMLRATKIKIGVVEENIVLAIFLVGAIYTAVRMSAAGLSSHSPIKGVHPLVFTTIICGITSIIYAVILTVRNTNLYLDGSYNFGSVALFIFAFSSMFALTELMCVVSYAVSRRKEKKELDEK